MKKSYAFSIFLLLIVLHLTAQITTPKIIPPSPGAVSFARYADVPVSYYNGLPQIEIPLYTLSCGKLSLPVYLSYYASGVKVEDMSTWAGLGWTLNAGGVITRTKRGNEENFPKNTSTKLDPGFGCLPIDFTDGNVAKHYADVANFAGGGTGDTESDIFHYNFNGKTGSFYVNKYNVPVLKKYDDLKIECTDDETNRFVITDTEGTKYYFGVRINKPLYETKTEWYLKKIVSADGVDVINLEYAYSYNEKEYLPRNKEGYYFIGLSPVPKKISSISPNNSTIRKEGDILSAIYTSHHDSIVFITKNGLNKAVSVEGISKYAQVLDKMVVYNMNKDIVKSYSFNTNFIQTIKPNTASIPGCRGGDYLNYRLYLDGIEEIGLKGEKIIHKFDYYGRTLDGRDSLPSCFSYAQDLGGFYNGIDANTTLIPAFNGRLNPDIFDWTEAVSTYPVEDVSIPGGNRATDFNYLKMGTLKSMHYPTGGSVKFHYSQKMSPQQDPYWGMDIAKIEYYDENGKYVRSKRYEYSEASLGHYIPSNITYAHYSPDKDLLSILGRLGKYLTIILLSEPQDDFGTFEGPAIGYGTVKEIEEGNGYTVYQFFNEDGYIEGSVFPIIDIEHVQQGAEYPWFPKNIGHLWPMGPLPDNSWKRGTLLSKTVYDNSLKINQQTINDYSFIELEKIPAIKVFAIEPDVRYLFYQYNYICSWIRLNTVTNVKDGVTTVTSYEYNSSFHKQKTGETAFLSDGKELRTEYKYAPDYLWPSATSHDSQSGILKFMSSKNMISFPIEVTQLKNESVINSTLNLYKLTSDNLIVPDVTYRLKIANPITLPFTGLSYTAFSPGSLSSSGKVSFHMDNLFKPEVIYDFYDNKGNIIQFHKENGTNTSYLWGYKQTLPVAEIKNASTSTLAMGNECSYIGFESYSNTADLPDNDYWFMNGDNGFSEDAHTGHYSRVVNGQFSFSRSFMPYNQLQKYKLSGWVKTQTGFAAGMGHLVVAVKDQNDNYLPQSSYFQVNFGDTYGQWKYFEIVVDLGSIRTINNLGEATYLKLNCYPWNQDYESHYFLVDDIRFQPYNSVMTTYTYDPLVGVTSVADENNVTSFYEYDSFGRLKLVKDSDGNILKQYQYHYKDQQ